MNYELLLPNATRKEMEAAVKLFCKLGGKEDGKLPFGVTLYLSDTHALYVTSYSSNRFVVRISTHFVKPPKSLDESVENFLKASSQRPISKYINPEPTGGSNLAPLKRLRPPRAFDPRGP
jgi:hypothetical protein